MPALLPHDYPTHPSMDYESALAAVMNGLDALGPAPGDLALLRAVAARMLVEGAAACDVRRAVVDLLIRQGPCP